MGGSNGAIPTNSMGIKKIDTDGRKIRNNWKRDAWGILGDKEIRISTTRKKIYSWNRHKTLEKIKSKGVFETNRVNRWIELIQEFNFRVEYIKGKEMGLPDHLSRQVSEDINKKRAENKKREWEKNMWNY